MNNHPRSFSARAGRRMHLTGLELTYPAVIKRITETPIGTAEAILRLPPQLQSPKLRSAAAGKLIDAISSLAGTKDQSVRKMKWLFGKLCHRSKSPIPYPFTPLPSQHAGEEVEDLITVRGEGNRTHVQSRSPW